MSTLSDLSIYNTATNGILGADSLGNVTTTVPNSFINTIAAPTGTGTIQLGGTNSVTIPTGQQAGTGSAQIFNSGTATTTTTSAQDIRVRLLAIVGQESNIYGPKGDSNVLSILYNTNGLLFPYTPSITVTQDVDYKSSDLVHMNGDIWTYTRTPSVSLSVVGKFTVQNQLEGQYALAVIHFLRVVSKMHFGQNDPQAGLPPPALLLRGYGNMMFNDLKVFVKNHSYSFDETVDYVDINSAGTTARLPSMFTINITLSVMQTPQAMRTQFNLADFTTGKLMTTQTGWI